MDLSPRLRAGANHFRFENLCKLSSASTTGPQPSAVSALRSFINHLREPRDTVRVVYFHKHIHWWYPNTILADFLVISHACIPTAFPSLLLWMRPKERTCQMPPHARCSRSFLWVTADTAQPLDGALSQFLNSIPEMVAGPLISKPPLAGYADGSRRWTGNQEGKGTPEMVFSREKQRSAHREHGGERWAWLRCSVRFPVRIPHGQQWQGLNEPQMPKQSTLLTRLPPPTKSMMRIWDSSGTAETEMTTSQASSLQTHEVTNGSVVIFPKKLLQ